MASRSFTRFLLALAALLLTGSAALAQSPECQRFKAELAALDQGGGRSNAANNQRAEIARLTNYYRSIGCERGPLAFLSGPPPAECAPISQQIRQMEANLARLSTQADESGIEIRRRQLQAAVQQTCSTEPRGFFEQLFGAPQAQPQPQAVPDEQIIDNQPQDHALGGRRLICVKSCDGSSFPLSVSPNGRDSAEEMCQSLCPGTETHAYSTSGGEEALNYAVSLSGQPYTSLPNAFKFRKTFDESCACKKEDESWSAVLRKAEGMLDQKNGDVLVTAEKADELSRPKAAAQPAKGKKQSTDDAEAEAAAAAAAAPTASSESSGIGPQSIEKERVISLSEGQKRVVTTDQGAKKTVRVIAPDMVAAPETPVK